jgi:hypothetical protein
VGAVEALGIGMWALLGLAGAWLLVTGRKMFFDLPKGMNEGWGLRLMGLGYVLAAGLLIYLVIRGSFSADGIVLGYFFFLSGLGIAAYRSRKAARVSEAPFSDS